MSRCHAAFGGLLGLLLFGCGGSPTPPQPPPPPPPPPPTIASVVIQPLDTTVDVEAGYSVRAEARDAQGHAIPGVTFQYQSADETVAGVTGAGGVLANAVGATTISASAGGFHGDATIRVKTRVAVFDLTPQQLFAEVYGVNDAGTFVGAVYGQGLPQAFVGRTTTGITLLPILATQFLVPSQARGINAAGTIAGYSITADQQAYNFVTWTSTGALVDHGLLGLYKSIGIAINNAGQIAFYRDELSSQGLVNQAAIRQADGTVVGIPPLVPLPAETMPLGLSSTGVVVGWSGQQPFIWHAGSGTQLIAGLPANSAPMAVASGDRVAGYYRTAGGNSAPYHAFYWSPGTGFQDIGTLGGAESYAFGINDAGTVVGVSLTAGGISHAFSWTQAQGMVDLGVTLPGASEARAISPSGIIAGLSFASSNPPPGNQLGANKPVLWIAKRRP